MFISFDPKTFRNPKSCSFSNGTTVYSNHSLPDDCSCVAPFFANADFAGAGIIASFCFLTWLTILVAAIPTFYSLQQSWRDASHPRRFQHFAADALQLHGNKNNITPFEQALNRPNTQPYVVAISKSLLIALTDVQVVTGIAFILTGLVHIKIITFYHEQIVVNLWWLTINSLWVSRIDYNAEETSTFSASRINNSTISSSPWRFQVRRIAIFTNVVLSAVFQGIIAVREEKQWDPAKSGRCYVGQALGGGYGSNIFWVVGTILYAIALFLGFWPRTRRWLDTKVFGQAGPSLDAIRTCMENDLSSLSLAKTQPKRLWLRIKYGMFCVSSFNGLR